ncbi:retropepsin-like aspartic protease family protein [Marinobacterium lacunae]|uniref:retropepsin-like aspartic protease family protein n=1 Tax=Marinobacterium lacunae TaxID=1232683 RepID=UPI0012DDFAC7|nr:retropepsin-like aspartic protease [Marinobacterium lacunae]
MNRSNNSSNPKGSRSSWPVAEGLFKRQGRLSAARGPLCKSLLLMLVLASLPVSAEIYHYIDERGRKVFVNRQSQIPIQFRDQVETRAEPGALNSHQELSPRDRQLNRLRSEIDSSLASLDEAIAELETPVRIIDNGVILPVRAVYGGRRADTQMLLDTGASGTVFHREALSGLNGSTYRAGKAKVASGDIIDVHAINLDRIEIGPFKIKSARAMVIDHIGRSRHDGLLGMDFLRQVQYKVDFQRKVIIWEPERYEELKAKRETLKAQQAMGANELIQSLTPKDQPVD